MKTDAELHVGLYYWLVFKDDEEGEQFIGQYTKAFGEGFYIMGVPDHIPAGVFIVLGSVSTIVEPL